MELQESELEGFLAAGKAFELGGLTQEEEKEFNVKIAEEEGGFNIKPTEAEGFNIKMPDYGSSNQPAMDPFLETVDVKLENVSSFILDCPFCHQSFKEMSDLNAHIVSCSDPATNQEAKI